MKRAVIVILAVLALTTPASADAHRYAEGWLEGIWDGYIIGVRDALRGLVKEDQAACVLEILERESKGPISVSLPWHLDELKNFGPPFSPTAKELEEDLADPTAEHRRRFNARMDRLCPPKEVK
jgi:hypothetical protein